ncbi:hypothetical protein MUK42_21520 [Musa troglodytarum]|uniref:Trypsin inhibitor n=1 Tax=Musa troglodytarum TaxID=320322 RepID=A0A9E7K3T3_9LILI|nr:hypothetical protein MUK42_21520 [Musa troglodytarum]
MAGGGKRGEASPLLLVMLLVTLLAFFATDSSAARVTPRPQSLARASSLLLATLLVTLLAFFATHSSAARVTPRPHSVARAALSALGVRQDAPCCICIVPPIYPPRPWSICGGEWQGSCPSACTNCECVLNECTCVGQVDTKACLADSCPLPDAAPEVEPSQQWAIEETGGKLATLV